MYEQQQKAAAEWAEDFFDQYHANEDGQQAATPAKIVFADMYTGDAPPDVISSTKSTRRTSKRDTASSGKRTLQRDDTLGYPGSTDIQGKVDDAASLTIPSTNGTTTNGTTTEHRRQERVASHKQASTSSSSTQTKATRNKRGVSRGRTLEAEEDERMERDGYGAGRKGGTRGQDGYGRDESSGDGTPGKRCATLGVFLSAMS